MITLDDWSTKFMPEFPSMLSRWKESQYEQKVLDEIIDEIMIKRNNLESS